MQVDLRDLILSGAGRSGVLGGDFPPNPRSGDKIELVILVDLGTESPNG